MFESETQLSHTSEPWYYHKPFKKKFYKGNIRPTYLLPEKDYSRAMHCVRACRDIPKPEEVVPKMIEAFGQIMQIPHTINNIEIAIHMMHQKAKEMTFLLSPPAEDGGQDG